MAKFSCLDHQVLLGALTAATGVALYSTYRLWALKRSLVKDNVYESQRSLSEYLVFHFGSPTDVLRWDSGPKDGVNFPTRCADLCIKSFKHVHRVAGGPVRALDIGCAVGRSSFDLANNFDEVVGIDYSHSFIDTCNELKALGRMDYEVTMLGDLTQKLEAVIDPKINRQKLHFMQGDACNLPSDLGQFDCVLAANLICRLHTPKLFFDRLKDLVAPGGILVITSPYTFLREYTPRENWIGGWKENGLSFSGFDGLKKLMHGAFDLVEAQDLPFLIRETERKHQWTVAHATVWQRKLE